MAQHASILGLIDREIERLQTVRALFTDENPGSQSSGKRPGRPAGGKRELSEEARQRIAAGQKKRWAAQKKANAS